MTTKTEQQLPGLATAMQQGMLLESSLADRPWANLEQVVLEGPESVFTADRLRVAWTELALRHDALRMVLVQNGQGHIRQHVRPDPLVAFDILSEDPAGIDAFLDRDRLAGIDPSAGPGWRVTLIPGTSRATMVWTIHHALIDGASLALVLEELGRLLQGQPAGPAPEQSLASFSAALAKQDKAAAKAFFASQFADGAAAQGFLPPSDRPPSRKRLVIRALSLAESDALRAATRAAGATTLNAVQLAWGLVLSRWTGQSVVDFGLVDSGRSLLPGLDRTIGCLISTLPMRIRVEGDCGLAAMLATLRQTTLAMRPHSHASPTEVRRWAGLAGRTTLFDTIVMYSRATLEGRMRKLGGVWADWTVRLIEEGAAPLTLAVADEPELQILIEHDPDRVPDATARALTDQVARLLQAMATAAPDLPLGALDMLGALDQAELLALGQPDQTLPADPPCIATRFETLAARQPEAVAVLDGETGAEMPYGALDQAANALASDLASAGVGVGDVVALHLPRGAGFICAMLAVLKLGAAFLPLDPDLPTDWLQSLMDRAGAKALISPETSALVHPCRRIPDLAARQPAPPPRPGPQADRLAYVLFTSGSTGTPKAVRGLTGALSAHASAIIVAYGLRPADRVLHFAGLGFDVALEEILPTLLAGGCVVARDEASKGSVRACVDLIARTAVTVANLPASFWHVLVEDMAVQSIAAPASLRLLVTGSERIRPQALRQWRALAPKVDWVNGYGPTEATITATAFVLPAGASLPEPLDEVPIGRPLAHATAILRAPDGSLTPRGGRGMLWIGGPAVTGGYLGDPDRSAEVFVPNPFAETGQLYRSGDHARWRADGMLDFLGRSDRQVKLRGQRIDLTQIEHQLAALPGVRQAHVALTPDAGGRLLAWVLTEPGTAVPALARLMKRRLPAAMVPHLIGIDHLPVGPTGKIDTAALPRPVPGPPATDLAPDDPGDDALTRAIAACMAEVLDRSSVPIDQSFSDMGGDSLLGLRLVSLIEQRTGHELQTADLHNHGSAAGLAEMLQTGSTRPRYTISIQPNGSKPAFFAIHVLGRNEDLFRPLAAALGPDQPVFGLSVGIPRNLDEISVERTARLYFEEIQTFHPEGPVGLGAVSMAAYFAFELAQLLRAAGREVRVLAVLDAMGPDGRPALTGPAKLRAHLGQVRRHGLWHFGRVVKNKIDRYREHRESLRTSPDRINPLDLIAANVVAVEFYRPQPYGGPLTVFRADHSFWDSPEAIASALGWASVAKGGVQMFDLPGTHLSILEPGNVDVLAGHLRRLLAGQQGDAD
ncbi:MAG: amino acid adenylation domain-containing protein [Pseudorhodobacter sp.]|nr:MAG: amino acid adenylation domain-containing protein [Pseudorhodobacter sp.]